MRILNAEPPEIEVTLERLQPRELAVLPDLQGKPPAGIEVDAAAHPKTVTALLPAETYLKVKEIKTAPIKLEELTRSTEMNVPLAPLPDVKPMADDWPRIVVRLTVRAREEAPPSPPPSPSPPPRPEPGATPDSE